MKRLTHSQINNPEYWNLHQTATDFGIRQEKYAELAKFGDRVVELGCGLSPLLDYLPYTTRYGVDFSPVTLETAYKRCDLNEYILSDCTKTPFVNKFFDVSIAGEVIEHLEDYQALIDEMVRITKNRIIISSPHLEFEDPEHIWEFDEQDFKDLLSPYGVVTVETIHSERFPGRSYIFATCDLK